MGHMALVHLTLQKPTVQPDCDCFAQGCAKKYQPLWQADVAVFLPLSLGNAASQAPVWVNRRKNNSPSP